MNRRAFLFRSTAGIGGATLLAGCTEENLKQAETEPPFVGEFVAEEEADLPVTQRLASGAAGVERAEGVEISNLDAFESYLLSNEIDVRKLEETTTEYEDEEIKPEVGAREHDPVVTLEYVVHETFEQGLMYHLGIVAGGYAALVAANHDSAKLEATLFEPDGGAFGEYSIRRRWAEEYVGGELSSRKYAGEVLRLAESK